MDHVHLLLDVADESDLPAAMQALKGVPARRVFQRLPELKMDAGVKSFWQENYGRKEITPSARAAVAHYIRTQWDRLEGFER